MYISQRLVLPPKTTPVESFDLVCSPLTSFTVKHLLSALADAYQCLCCL